jgi:glucose/arabinose dehydrogenase
LLKRPKPVEKAIVYVLGAHTASLGLAFCSGKLLPARYAGGAFIGQHGSWSRNPLSGYKVIFVPFFDGHPSGMPKDILTGFVKMDTATRKDAHVGVTVDRDRRSARRDDVGNIIWRVTPQLR